VFGYDGRTGEVRALYVMPFLDENLMKEDFTGPGPMLAWYTQDGLGSVRQLVVGERVLNSYAYTAWGVPLDWHEHLANRSTFMGYSFNPEINLYSAGATYYDSKTGRHLRRYLVDLGESQPTYVENCNKPTERLPLRLRRLSDEYLYSTLVTTEALLERSPLTRFLYVLQQQVGQPRDPCFCKRGRIVCPWLAQWLEDPKVDPEKLGGRPKAFYVTPGRIKIGVVYRGKLRNVRGCEIIQHVLREQTWRKINQRVKSIVQGWKRRLGPKASLHFAGKSTIFFTLFDYTGEETRREVLDVNKIWIRISDRPELGASLNGAVIESEFFVALVTIKGMKNVRPPGLAEVARWGYHVRFYWNNPRGKIAYRIIRYVTALPKWDEAQKEVDERYQEGKPWD